MEQNAGNRDFREMTFVLSPEQVAKAREWSRKHPCFRQYKSALTKYTFTITGVEDVATVACSRCGEEIEV